MPSLADMRVVRTIETRATTSGVRETTAALNEMAGAHNKVGAAAAGSAEVTETSARRSGTLAGAYEKERRALDPLIAAREKYERTMRNLDRGLSAGADVNEHARLAEMARARFDRLTGANDNLTRSIGLQRHEWVNLGRQMQDVGTMAAMGASGMQILTSQAAQVYDVLASSRGGVGGALKEVGSTLLGLLTPARVVFGGIATGAFAAGAAVFSYLSQQKELETRLNGIGRASGMTTRDVNRIATARSSTAGISVGDARDALGTYAATGRIGEEIGTGLLPVGRSVSKMLGVDLAESNELLAKAFADPTKGAEALNERLGNLNDSTRRTIELQMAAGDRLGAQRTLMDSVGASTAAATEKLSLWMMAWLKAKGAFDAVGKAGADLIAPDTLTQLEEARKRLDELRRSEEGMTEAQRRRTRGAWARESGQTVEGAQKRVQELEDQRRKEEKAAAETRENQRSRDVGERVRPYVQERDEIEKMRAELRGLEADRKSPPKDIAADRIDEAYQRAKGAVDTYLTSEEKRRQADDLAIRSINARTDAERAGIAVDQKRLELAGQKLTADERQRALDAARAQETARSTKEAEDRLRASNDNLSLSGLLPYQRAQQEIEQRFRRQNEANAGNPEALRRNAQIRANELQALDREQIQGALRSTTMSINEQIGALKLQRDSLFATDEAAATYAAKQELTNTAIRAGIDPAKAYGGQLDELATKMGQVGAANLEFQRAKSNISGGLDEIRSGFSGMMSGVSSDLMRNGGKGIGQTLLNSALRMNDQLLERVVFKPLTEAAFGRFGQTGGGLLGDVLGKSGLFGDLSKMTMPQTITAPMATVQAASVIVNGGALTAGAGVGMGALGLGTNPATGSPIAGAGSGLLGFGLGGAQAAGSATVGSGLSSFGFGALGTAGSGSTLTGDMARYARAIQSIESGGKYDILGPVTKTGDRAYGAYQVMGANVPSWTQQALGKSLSPQEFLGSKSAQDAVFSRIFGGYVERFGPTGAAQAWFGGPGSVGKLGRQDVLGTSVGAYGNKFNRALGNQPRADLDAAKQLQDSTGAATKSMADLGDAAQKLPDAVGSAENSLGDLASSLFNFRPGAGSGSGMFASMFGGGNGSGGGGIQDVATWSANGNIMTSRGPLALNYYEKGGIATSPQLSIFGEGRLPEAYVPLPDGRSIPVTMKDARPQTAPAAANSNGGSFTYHEAPIQSAGGVTPEQWMAARQQDRTQMMRDLKRNFGSIAAEPQRRFG